MKSYRLIEAVSGRTIYEKNLRGDKTAGRWLADLQDRGVVGGVPLRLQRRTMSGDEAAALPPFASGRPRVPWEDV